MPPSMSCSGLSSVSVSAGESRRGGVASVFGGKCEWLMLGDIKETQEVAWA